MRHGHATRLQVQYCYKTFVETKIALELLHRTRFRSFTDHAHARRLDIKYAHESEAGSYTPRRADQRRRSGQRGYSGSPRDVLCRRGGDDAPSNGNAAPGSGDRAPFARLAPAARRHLRPPTLLLLTARSERANTGVAFNASWEVVATVARLSRGGSLGVLGGPLLGQLVGPVREDLRNLGRRPDAAAVSL